MRASTVAHTVLKADDQWGSVRRSRTLLWSLQKLGMATDSDTVLRKASAGGHRGKCVRCRWHDGMGGDEWPWKVFAEVCDVMVVICADVDSIAAGSE
jgi:hypothetical protein